MSSKAVLAFGSKKPGSKKPAKKSSAAAKAGAKLGKAKAAAKAARVAAASTPGDALRAGFPLSKKQTAKLREASKAKPLEKKETFREKVGRAKEEAKVRPLRTQADTLRAGFSAPTSSADALRAGYSKPKPKADNPLLKEIKSQIEDRQVRPLRKQAGTLRAGYLPTAADVAKEEHETEARNKREEARRNRDRAVGFTYGQNHEAVKRDKARQAKLELSSSVAEAKAKRYQIPITTKESQILRAAAPPSGVSALRAGYSTPPSAAAIQQLRKPNRPPPAKPSTTTAGRLSSTLSAFAPSFAAPKSGLITPFGAAKIPAKKSAPAPEPAPAKKSAPPPEPAPSGNFSVRLGTHASGRVATRSLKYIKFKTKISLSDEINKINVKLSNQKKGYKKFGTTNIINTLPPIAKSWYDSLP